MQARNNHELTTKSVSEFQADPPLIIHLVSYSRYRVFTQVSLQTGWPGF